MAVDMFLKIDGIDGESQDDMHPKEVDILAWSWGMSQSGTTHLGSGGGSGKVNVQDISFTKYIDVASVELMRTCTSGKHISEATLVVRKASGDKPLEYITLKMEDIIVSSYSTGGSGGEDRLTENVSFNFSKYTITYIEQTEEGGEGLKPELTYDIAANKIG
jgi:type VI secretion system secreted protein Hcp